ncbi:hypothetical protein PUNSTDRAFT_120530 [Punctularia strigosozonata HHB-11173 SS5]|uniref:uncharacterized protein n=1 Tax=Punctularia strigosozonata (strain HHB-11173) TaxID=741275 RepID=UPI000441659E|nr:uncharacterized protein PUNSTDRAFT_120530 [Punctularia strigosozonata HHB-11173 SS5]EIN09106.1 hypothetical protein PUNSTDRAFT_120530 [Punctularia strigosozonata HHB-11173 SS5]
MFPVAVLHAQTDVFITRYIYTVSFAVLYYDYALTLGTEIARYWGRRLTWPSAFFLVNRYLSLLGFVPIVFESYWAPSDQDKCHVWHIYHQIFAVVLQIIVGVLQIMRTYALYGRSRAVLIFLVTWAVIVVIIALWAILGDHSPTITLTAPGLSLGCMYILTRNQAIHLTIAWSGQLAFDCIIFALTAARSIQHTKLKVFLPGTRPRDSDALFTVLIRDGAVYFAVLTLSSLANILSFVLLSPALRGVLTIPTNVLAASLISRLMINVRDPRIVRFATPSQTRPTLLGGHGPRPTNEPYVSTVLEISPPSALGDPDYGYAEYGYGYANPSQAEQEEVDADGWTDDIEWATSSMATSGRGSGTSVSAGSRWTFGRGGSSRSHAKGGDAMEMQSRRPPAGPDASAHAGKTDT